jgi:hypothetical protein
MKLNAGQSIGRLGERWFQYVLPKEWIFQQPNVDVGIDGRVIIIDSNKHLSGLEFDVQIKTSKEWLINNNFIKLERIKLSSIKYWSSRLIPVLLILYDEKHDTGYYNWISETWENRDPLEYIRSQSKTISIPINTKNIISKQSWDLIKADVLNYYRRIATSYEKLNFIPHINKLITCIWYLQQIITIEPQTDDEKRQDKINIVISYRNLLDILNKIYEQYSYLYESDFSERVKKFHDSIKVDVEMFIRDFSEIIKSENSPKIVLINMEIFKEKTPLLILKVLNLLMEITKREGIMEHLFTNDME